MKCFLRLFALSVLVSLPSFAAEKPAHPPAPDTSQGGVAKADLTDIREAYEAGRHAFQPVAGGWQARNPGQQWLVKFDGRGFIAEPQGATWRWGLELRSYGFAGRECSTGGLPAMHAEGQRLACARDAAMEEWFVNDARGLEHGFTLRERPPGGAEGRTLQLDLAVRGNLRARVSAGRAGVEFLDAEGATVLTYTGLKAWDADGTVLPAHFEPAGECLRVRVDERTARYPITVDPIAQQAYLKASNTDAGDEFGSVVAASGDTVVVGASKESSKATGVDGDQSDNSMPRAGAVYVFVRKGSVWRQQAYLKASNTGKGDAFGNSVAISGDTLVVGAPYEHSTATGINGDQTNVGEMVYGAVYIFTRNNTVWTQQAYLKASNATARKFGWTVAISGDNVVTGTPDDRSKATGINGDQDDISLSGAGAAYVFVRNGKEWKQEAYLKPSNTHERMSFGASVAVSGDVIIVGAPREQSNATGINGNQNDRSFTFGSGAAYVFDRKGAEWTQQAYLKAINNAPYTFLYGHSVAASGGTIVIGAYGEASGGTGAHANPKQRGGSSGAVYIYSLKGTEIKQQGFLKGDTIHQTQFGYAVAIDRDIIAVGASWDRGGSDAAYNDIKKPVTSSPGAAYLFTKTSTGSWMKVGMFRSSNPGVCAQFGHCVAVSGDVVVVGTPAESCGAKGVNGNGNDRSAERAGAAYVFQFKR